MENNKRILLLIAGIIVLVCLLSFVTRTISNFTGYAIKASMADCLREKGVVLYCKENTPICQNQVERLGIYFNNLNYVICYGDSAECFGIEEFPAWKYNNIIYYGEKNLEELAGELGC